MIDYEVAIGLVFIAYIICGTIWTGFFDLDPQPKNIHPDSLNMQAWQTRDRKKTKKMAIWVGGLFVL